MTVFASANFKSTIQLFVQRAQLLTALLHCHTFVAPPLNRQSTIGVVLRITSRHVDSIRKAEEPSASSTLRGSGVSKPWVRVVASLISLVPWSAPLSPGFPRNDSRRLGQAPAQSNGSLSSSVTYLIPSDRWQQELKYVVMRTIIQHVVHVSCETLSQ